MIVKILDSVKNYEEAIKCTCEMLEENESVDSNYYDAIMNKIEEFGPYFCIAKYVAMPHARPEDGVKKSDLSILKLNNSVDFLGRDIKVLFTISAKDSSSHLDIIKKVAEICMDENKLNTIINAKEINEIMEVL